MPQNWETYAGLDAICENRAVILSPYAKSVTTLPVRIWEEITSDYSRRGYQVFTNVAGEEQPLPGTQHISPAICKMKSVVERAAELADLRACQLFLSERISLISTG